jgi:hypothetical protein
MLTSQSISPKLSVVHNASSYLVPLSPVHPLVAATTTPSPTAVQPPYPMARSSFHTTRGRSAPLPLICPVLLRFQSQDLRLDMITKRPERGGGRTARKEKETRSSISSPVARSLTCALLGTILVDLDPHTLTLDAARNATHEAKQKRPLREMHTPICAQAPHM